MLAVYYKNVRNKLQYVFTDTTFVCNKYGSEGVSYNGQKKRNGTKISLITDSNGIPFSIKIADSGSMHDLKILLQQLDNPILINQQKLIDNCNYFIADSAYDSVNVRNKLYAMGYHNVMIWRNKRNSKIKQHISHNEQLIYNKRMHIEHINNKLKQFRRLNVRYDKCIATFYNFVVLSCISILKHFTTKCF